MRKHYVRMKEGKSSHLTPERIQRMTQIGFSFVHKVERLTFDDRALQWLEYRTKHGCDPPTTDTGNNLGHWVRYVFRKLISSSEHAFLILFFSGIFVGSIRYI